MHESNWVKQIEQKFTPQVRMPLQLSVIIPTFNCSEKLLISLESIKKQKYESCEVIIVDAGSIDHTLDVARSYFPLVKRIYSVTHFHLFEMINRGISLSEGKFLTILTPGSFYLSGLVFETVMEKSAFDFIYFGSIQRQIKKEPRLIHFPFDFKWLQQGIKPASLPACFFQTEIFEKVGKFRHGYFSRAFLDLLIRIYKYQKFKVFCSERIYIDADASFIPSSTFLKYICETWLILDMHFGFWKAIRSCLRGCFKVKI